MFLSGWSQSPRKLASLIPGAVGFDYSVYENMQQAAEAMSYAHPAPELLGGWSLGGMVALYAAAHGYVKPKKMAIIASGYQFVATDNVPDAMPKDVFDSFREGYIAQPERTLKKLDLLMAHGDSAYKPSPDAVYKPQGFGLLWLDELAAFRADALALEGLPPTLLIYGRNDAVVTHKHAERYKARIPFTQLHVFDECGHAPHFHDAERVSGLLEFFRQQRA